MASLISFLPLALEGEWHDIRAILVVLVAIIVLIGSIYMLLASNFGARLGYLILMVSFCGFTTILSLMWLVGAPGTAPGLGPRAGAPSTKLLVATEPHYVPFLADSDQGREFAAIVGRFPNGWDPLGKEGKEYPGKINSRGEFDIIKTALADSLAALARTQGLPGKDKVDWDVRLKGSPALTEADKAIPEVEPFFYQNGTPLLAGMRIPATDKHREVLVFAFRDKGRVFLYALYFVIFGILGFAFHVWLLSRYERRQKLLDAEMATT